MKQLWKNHGMRLITFFIGMELFGGKYGFYITNEREEEIKPEGLLNFNFDDDDCFTNNS